MTGRGATRTVDNPPHSRAIAVLGMHRSGTSITTRVLQLLGAYLGEEEEMAPPFHDNPDGYWERADIVLLNDRILQALNTAWDTAFPLPDGWHRSAEVAPLRAELADLIRAKFIHRRLWAWKDPWARGYFVSTVGRDEERIRAYIRNQEQEDQRLDQRRMEY